MELSYLTLRRSDWGPDKGTVKGEITFNGRDGSVSLVLSPVHCERILAVVADALIAQAEDCATSLTAAVIDAARPQALPQKD